jgi:hypothetical protein
MGSVFVSLIKFKRKKRWDKYLHRFFELGGLFNFLKELLVIGTIFMYT